MKKRSKRYNSILKTSQKDKKVETKEAFELVKKNSTSKFDESIDVSLRVNLKQSKNEIKYKLEQLRALENGINIDVVYSKNKSFGIDTVEDYVEIKKIMEYKIKKL